MGITEGLCDFLLKPCDYAMFKYAITYEQYHKNQIYENMFTSVSAYSKSLFVAQYSVAVGLIVATLFIYTCDITLFH